MTPRERELTDLLDECRETIRQMRAAVAPVDMVAEYRGLSLSRGERVLLKALRGGRIMSYPHLMLCVSNSSGLDRDRDRDGNSTLKIMIHRLRKKLAPHSATISMVYGVGYWMDEISLLIMDELQVN